MKAYLHKENRLSSTSYFPTIKLLYGVYLTMQLKLHIILLLTDGDCMKEKQDDHPHTNTYFHPT